MATNAAIKINGGTPGQANTTLTLDSTVNLSNQNAGNEFLYEWTIVSQPAGTPGVVFVDSGTITSSAPAPSFVITKEGSYLIRLIVNKDEPDEKMTTTICAVRELQTGSRIPAAQETTEVDEEEGWAVTAVDEILQRVTRLTDAGIFVAKATEAIELERVVHMTGMDTIATGLPGERRIPEVAKASASTLTKVDGPLGIMVGLADGTLTSASAGQLCRVMVTGGLHAVTISGPLAAIGDPVFVDNEARLSLSPGDKTRQVGDIAKVVTVFGTYDVAISAGSNSIPRGDAGGDLDGAFPNPTVIKINGTTVTTGGSVGNVLRMTGINTAEWGPVNLQTAASVDGPLLTIFGGTGTSTASYGPNCLIRSNDIGAALIALDNGDSGSILYTMGEGSGPGYGPFWLKPPATNGSFLASNKVGAPTWVSTVSVERGGTGVSSFTPNSIIYSNIDGTELLAHPPPSVSRPAILTYDAGALFWNIPPTGTSRFLTYNYASNNLSWVTLPVPILQGGTGRQGFDHIGGLVYLRTATDLYAIEPPAGVGSVLTSGATSISPPVWGTVPEAAFADTSIPYSAIQSNRTNVDYPATYTNVTAVYSTVATVTYPALLGLVHAYFNPIPNGAAMYNQITAASNNTTVRVDVRYTITGPGGFSQTQTFSHYTSTASAAGQVMGSMAMPPVTFFASTTGSYTITVQARVGTAGDQFDFTAYRFSVQQG